MSGQSSFDECEHARRARCDSFARRDLRGGRRVTGGSTSITLTLVVICVLLGFELKAELKPEPVLWLESGTMFGRNAQELSLLIAVQGIVNREKPLLMTDSKEMLFADAGKEWRRYLEKDKGFAFENASSLGEVIIKFKSHFKGLVVYDPKSDAQTAIAMTMSGLMDYLPLTPEMLENRSTTSRKIMPVAGAVDPFTGLEVKEDLRAKFKNSDQAFEWAYKELYPKCNKEYAFSIKHNDWYSAVYGDLVIAQKGFCLSAKTKQDGKESPKRLNELFAKLNPYTLILGWADSEWYLVNASSLNNCYLAGGAPNLSFWNKVPLSGPVKHIVSQPRKKKLENKYYVIYQTGDGDHSKMMNSLQNGNWLLPERGKVAMNWGMQPLLLKAAPAMMEYYARTATDKDGFFAGPSGAGYVHPAVLSDFLEYAKRTRQYVDSFGMAAVEMWEVKGVEDYSLYKKFNTPIQGIPPVKLFTEDRLQGGTMPYAATNRWMDDGTMIIQRYGLLHVWGGRLRAFEDRIGEMVRRIEAVANVRQPPFFITIYHHVEACLEDITERLPADKFEVITLQEAVQLGQEAGSFTVDSPSVGGGPSEKIQVEITVRNLSNASIDNGNVTVKLPQNWTASLDKWNYGSLAAGQIKTQAIEVTPFFTSAPSQAVENNIIYFQDNRFQWNRSIKPIIYPESRTLLSPSIIGQASFTGQVAKDPEVIKAKGVISTKGGSVSIDFEADFDKRPYLEILLKNVESKSNLSIDNITSKGSKNRWLLPGSGGVVKGTLLYDLSQITKLKGICKLRLSLNGLDLAFAKLHNGGLGFVPKAPFPTEKPQLSDDETGVILNNGGFEFPGGIAESWFADNGLRSNKCKRNGKFSLQLPVGRELSGKNVSAYQVLSSEKLKPGMELEMTAHVYGAPVMDQKSIQKLILVVADDKRVGKGIAEIPLVTTESAADSWRTIKLRIKLPQEFHSKWSIKTIFQIKSSATQEPGELYIDDVSVAVVR